MKRPHSRWPNAARRDTSDVESAKGCGSHVPEQRLAPILEIECDDWYPHLAGDREQEKILRAKVIRLNHIDPVLDEELAKPATQPPHVGQIQRHHPGRSPGQIEYFKASPLLMQFALQRSSLEQRTDNGLTSLAGKGGRAKPQTISWEPPIARFGSISAILSSLVWPC